MCLLRPKCDTAALAFAFCGMQAPFVNYVVCLGVLRGIQDTITQVCPVSVSCYNPHERCMGISLEHFVTLTHTGLHSWQCACSEG